MPDLRYALRMLLRQRGFTAIAVLALALGMGANTAIFSIANAVVLRPLPYPDPDRLVILNERTQSGEVWNVWSSHFLEWEAGARSFSAMAAVAGGNAVLTGRGEPERIPVVRVSSGFFRVFGCRPAQGRAFDAAEPAALLSYSAWDRRFGRDPGVIGKPVTLDGGSFTVVGVLPASFRFMRPFEMVLPLAASRMDDRSLLTFAVRRPGVSLQAARQEMERFGVSSGWTVTVHDLQERLTAGPRQDLPILAGAAGFVLLIACANVASLLLAKGAARRREIAIRASLGASRVRIVRQLLTESALLSLGGGALGVVLAHWIVRALARAIPPAVLPPGAELTIDATVLAYAFALSAITGVVFGLVPAWRASRVQLHDELKQGARGAAGTGTRLRGALVVAELALSLILTAGAALMVQSLANAHQAYAGFDGANVLTFRIEAHAGDSRAFVRRSVESLAALPGVASAGFSTQLPMQGWGLVKSFEVNGQRHSAHLQVVSPEYLRTLRIRVRKGREFGAQDNESSPPVAIVNETFVRRFLNGEEPLGRRVDSREIVGVVESIGMGNIDARSPELYVPFAQNPHPAGYFSLRTAGDPAGYLKAARAAMRALDPNAVLSDARTMEQIRDRSFAIPRVIVSLFGGFGALALLLAVMGIYGLLAWVVAQRTREMGIRSALGAGRGALLKLVLGHAAALAGTGVVIGLAGALALMRVLRHMLAGVAPHDPLTLAATATLLFSVALAAAWLPARRAARVDPIVALRQD